MINNISFPNLGLDFVLDRIAFSVFGIDIYWYAVIITCGMILSFAYGLTNCKRFGIKADDIIDGALFGVPAAIIGARLYFVIFKFDTYNSFSEMINIRDGGLAIYGAVIAVMIVVVIFARVKKLSILAIADIVSLSFLIGQCIGRWGNFVNGEAFGQKTDSLLGMSINGGAMVEPTFLYESIGTCLGFILIHIFSKKLRKGNGEVFCLYVLWYGVLRGFIEGRRSDSLFLGSIRISQWLGFISAAIALVGFIILYRKHKDSIKQDGLEYENIFSAEETEAISATENE